MAFEKPIRTDDDAQVQIAAACHELAAFYDVMILDVPVTDAGLMRVIAGISDEVHLILPDMPIGMRSEEDWRYKIGLCESEKSSPKVVTYAERSRLLPLDRKA